MVLLCYTVWMHRLIGELEAVKGPAPTETSEGARPAFVRLRRLAEELRARGSLPLSELSMGMSHDYAVAVGEGATIVRVGSAIFGKRDYA